MNIYLKRAINTLARRLSAGLLAGFADPEEGPGPRTVDARRKARDRRHRKLVRAQKQHMRKLA